LGSSEENHLPHFRKSDVNDDVTVTSWVGDDVTTILQTSAHVTRRTAL